MSIHILICTMRICVNLWVQCAWWTSISHSPHNSHEIYWNEIYSNQTRPVKNWNMKIRNQREIPNIFFLYSFFTFTLFSSRKQPHNTVHRTEQRRVHQGFSINRWKQRQKIVAFSCRELYFFFFSWRLIFIQHWLFLFIFFFHIIISCMIYYA